MRFSAGFSGAAIRGDCRVTVWSESEPILSITSRVLSLYGESIEVQLLELIGSLGVKGTSVEVEDEGALPYVIAARVEAAAKRAGIDAEALPAKRVCSETNRARRTRLYVPGNTPKLQQNVGLYQADAVILDLEDSVPRSEKDAARILVRNALRTVDFGTSERIVRINAGSREDVEAVRDHGVETLIIPKVESAADVTRIDDYANQQLLLIPLIETAKGIANADEIGNASPRVSALAVGLEDYAADIGAKHTGDVSAFGWALAAIVNAARAAGIAPLGPAIGDFEDLENFGKQVLALAQMGFEGVSCIHPSQIAVAHRVFAPSESEIEWASNVHKTHQAALAGNLGTSAHLGQMIDAPVAARAERILHRAGVRPS